MPVIEFLCPNGHRIRCQVEHAGRAAKCPRCGVKFRVPESADLNLASGDSDPNISGPDFSDSGVTGQSPPAPVGAAPEPEIEFLCPNRHHLRGPASLQGKPGECPQCGSRFLIPDYDEVSTGEESPPPAGFVQTDTGYELGAGGPIAGANAASEMNNGRTSSGTHAAPTVAAPAAGSGSAGQAMAALFVRLWRLRGEGMNIELRMHNGDILIPAQFIERMSQPSHGVFAVKEADGSTSLVVAAWESVERATLRGLSQLPKDLP